MSTLSQKWTEKIYSTLKSNVIYKIEESTKNGASRIFVDTDDNEISIFLMNEVVNEIGGIKIQKTEKGSGNSCVFQLRWYLSPVVETFKKSVPVVSSIAEINEQEKVHAETYKNLVEAFTKKSEPVVEELKPDVKMMMLLKLQDLEKKGSIMTQQYSTESYIGHIVMEYIHQIEIIEKRLEKIVEARAVEAHALAHAKESLPLPLPYCEEYERMEYESQRMTSEPEYELTV